jgi:hypothetical protein
MPRVLLRVLLALALAAVACGRRTVLTDDDIRFTHGPHLRAGVACLTCHSDGVPDGGVAGEAGVVTDAAAGADAGTTPGGRVNVMPREASCRGCHTRPEQQRCEFCHTEPRAPRTWRRENRALRFDHGPHVARLNGGCVRCHGYDLDGPSASRFEPQIPSMATCTDSCHARDMRELACSRCHTSLSRYTPEALSLVRHPPGFARRHSVEARADERLCSQCHEPSYCVRCHTAGHGPPLAGVEPMRAWREFIHRGDFIARHGSEARLDQASCVRCHAVDTCDTCHRGRGVGGSVAPGSVHPAGWLDPFSPRGHARAARRDLLTCVGCHESDATRTCVPCHRVGAGAGNPHPPGFSAGLDPQRHGVCLACHGAGP